MKVLISLGGWEDSSANETAESKYSRLARSSKTIERFADDTIKFLKEYRFDGIDIDWEYPGCPQAVCSQRYRSDVRNFVGLVKVCDQDIAYI